MNMLLSRAVEGKAESNRAFHKEALEGQGYLRGLPGLVFGVDHCGAAPSNAQGG